MSKDKKQLVKEGVIMATLAMHTQKDFAEQSKKVKQMSWKKRVLNYLWKSLEISAPAIITMHGGYYRPYNQ